MRAKDTLPPIDEHTQRHWGCQRSDHSAGGLIYRVEADGEVVAALIATRRGTRWQLPKGTCESGETLEETALREVAEECGLTGSCEAHLGTVEYWYWDTYQRKTPELVHKQVDFYLMHWVGGELSDASVEVDSVNWFTLRQALEVLTFAAERSIVHRALALLCPVSLAGTAPGTPEQNFQR